MGRLIRVILYALVVLVLYFWVTSLLKSYRQNQELKNLTESGSLDTSRTSDSITLSNGEEYSDSSLINEDSAYEEIDKTIEELSSQVNKNAESNQSIQQQAVKKSQPVVEKRKDPVAPQNKSGNYMVIAGSFIKEENARQQLKKLKSIGYSEAEIKIFVSSEYHSVIVSRHANSNDAERVVQDLRKKGIESFVKEKK